MTLTVAPSYGRRGPRTSEFGRPNPKTALISAIVFRRVAGLATQPAQASAVTVR